MSDERNGKPSASGMSRLALCPGSWNLESTQPEQDANQYMQLGTDVHAVLAGTKDIDELSEEGQDIATRCISEFSEMIGQLDLGPRTKEIVEQRFWYDDKFSGAIDRVDFFGEDTAVVTDYKTGRVAQSNAAENYQLRAYAVLVKKAYPELKTIFVAIIQPMASGKTIAEYGEAELEAADKEIAGIVNASLKQDAPRTPSPDACKWCRAKDICPDRYEAGQAATRQLQVVSGVVVSQLSDEELVNLDDKALVVEDFIDEVRKELKSRLVSGKQIAGRSLTKGRTSRSVTDPSACADSLIGVFSPLEFVACTKVSITALEKAYAAKKGVSVRDAKSELESLLGWIIETRDGEPSIKRDK